jgi:hypothetical protein
MVARMKLVRALGILAKIPNYDKRVVRLKVLIES